MEYWIQGALFPDVSDVPAKHKRVDSRKLAMQPSRRHNWTHVNSDPAVADSYANAARVGADFRVGLARAYGQLSPEERGAIRSILAPRGRRAA